MSNGERFKREDPERVAPRRGMSGAFRQGAGDGSDADGERPTPPPEAQPGAAGEVIHRTVNLAYEVIDAQIRQGRKTAEELSQRLYPGGAAGGDVAHLTTSFLRSWMDLTNRCVELATGVLGNVARPEEPAPVSDDGAGASAEPAPPSVLIVDVDTGRRATVTLQLSAATAGRSLGVRRLEALDPAKPALAGVSLQPARNGQPLGVRVRIPPAQPAGTYSGAIYDLDSGSGEGTLTLELE